MANSRNKIIYLMLVASAALITVGVRMRAGVLQTDKDNAKTEDVVFSQVVHTQVEDPVTTTQEEDEVLEQTVSATAERLYPLFKSEDDNSQVYEPTSKDYKLALNWEVSEPDGFINGHGYVDLGLPSGLKWATANVGSSSAEEYGSYFAWGETKPKNVYSTENNPTFCQDSLWLLNNKYVTKEGNLTLEHDAARQNWGGTWRMPTKEEVAELIENTCPYWVTRDEVNGILMVNKDGKNIFLPPQGDRVESKLYGSGEHGCYWTSSVDRVDKAGLSDQVFFNSKGYYMNGVTRDYGYAIRPVSE